MMVSEVASEVAQTCNTILFTMMLLRNCSHVPSIVQVFVRSVGAAGIAMFEGLRSTKNVLKNMCEYLLFRSTHDDIPYAELAC